MDPASWMSAAIRTGPGTARLGCAIDVAITLAALWSLVDARLFVREPVSAKRLAAMAAFCALLLAPGYAEVTAERAAFLAASLSLAIQPLARRSASSPGACLHLARALRLARAASPLSPPAAATGAGLHIAAALFLLEARHSRFVGTHIRGFFGCRGFALAAIYRKRELVVEDLRDQRSEDAYFESCRRLEFNPHERLFVLRAILRVEWKALTAVVVANTLNEVATHCRRLVFVAIIAALGGERSTSAADLAVMFALWQLLALTTLASQYIATIERGISLRITSVLSSKILEININSRFSVYSTMGLTSTADAFGTGVVSLERAISSALSQAVNVWIVASKVGWWFMIPVAIVSTHEVLSYLLSSKTRRLQDRREREEQPKYWQDFYAMAPFMRAIKFYAWEEVFRGVVGYLDIVRTQPAIWRIAMHAVNTLGCATSQIASAITITSYIRSAGVARYSDVSLLMGSIASLAAFTSTASGFARTCISMERGSRFVREVAAEDKERYIHREPVAGTTPVVLEDCTFSWGADKFSLPRMTLSIAAGEFVTVVGRVGSGKSSLVSALCGEMPLVDGAGRLCGRIGYVSQKPRVMDGTFRENVLMGEDYDEKLFWQIIHACALTHDLEQMDSSDLTRVGYNGVNLSGGQVARLALARALYRQADVYIFDDLLAAVDSRVERHLVHHVLCAEGIIGSKTRILVTHATHVVPLSSRVITLSEGHVDIATQTPAPFSSGLLDIPTPPDSGSDGEASDIAAEAKPFVVHLEDEKPPVRWSHLAKFAQLSGYWVLAAVAILKIAGFCAVFYADRLRIGLMVDNNPNTMVQSLQHYLLVNALVEIGRQQLSTFEQWTQNNVWLRPLAERTRRQTLDVILSMPLQGYERLSSIGIQNIFHTDRAGTVNALPSRLNTTIHDVMSALLSLVQAAMVAPMVFWISVPLSAVVYLTDRCASVVNRAVDTSLVMANKPLQSTVLELLFYKVLYRIHGSSGRLLRNMQELEASMVGMWSAYYAVDRARDFINGLLRELVRTAALLFSLWQGAIRGQTTSAGKVDVETSLLLDVLTRIGCVAHASTTMEITIQYLACHLRNTESLPREPRGVAAASPPDASWPDSGRIEFQGYSMRYRPDMDLVLKDLSFSVGAREKVGIVGRTGAGKSSLTQAIMRMVEPDSGRVLIDGIDTVTICLHDLRSRISVIPQDPALFSGTIRDNLDPMRKYTDDDVWRAVRAARIDSLLEKPSGKYVEQPDYDLFDEDKGRWIEGVGLDKWVTWGGSSFSVGQRQLISICRALLWRRQILILDEATANIDDETDQVIQSVLRSEFKDCTVLTIAHRLETVMDCDRILVMDQGRAVEFDTPANLLARESQFAQLVESMRLSKGH